MKKQKSLKDIAGIYKQAVSNAIKSGPTKAYRTGNLYRKFNQDPRNSASQVGFKENENFIFRVVVGPRDAEYGSYVNSGTKYMKARPFAEVGAKSKEFTLALDEFMNGQVSKKLEDEFITISKDFKKAGFSVS
tara:strand:- start:11537 stop:11935 length:399 start_codon:yes stop_codon:yes gene_type:complete